MSKFFLALCIGYLYNPFQLLTQSISGSSAIEKNIAFHDPHNRWQHFKDTLNFIRKFPEKPSSESNQIKVPRIRSWYYNKDQSFIVRDILRSW